LNVIVPVGLDPFESVAVSWIGLPTTTPADAFVERLGAATFTVWVSVELVLAWLFVSPPYTPVMLWLPADKPEVVHVAVPLLNACAPQPPIVVPPSLKSTVPDGLSPATVAVNVTD